MKAKKSGPDSPSSAKLPTTEDAKAAHAPRSPTALSSKRATDLNPSPDTETFDEFLVRTGSAPTQRVDPYAGLDPMERYRREAKDALLHDREDFRRLVDDDCFAHVAALMDTLLSLA